jgi:hypothetical protein
MLGGDLAMNTMASLAPRRGRVNGSVGLGLAILAILTCVPALAVDDERVAEPIPPTRVALVDVSDGSHYSHAGMSDMAAVGLLTAMEDVEPIQIVHPEDVWQAIEALEVRPPFADEQLQALGEALDADVVIAARIAGLLFIDHSEQAICALRLRVLNRHGRMEINTFQVRAKAEQNGHPLGERQLVHNAIVEAAHEGVEQIKTVLTIRGLVSMPFDTNRIRLDQGSEDGMRLGTKVAVYDNSEWVADLEIIQVSTLSARAEILKGDFDALYTGIGFYVTEWPAEDREPSDYEEGEVDKAEEDMPD